MCIIATNSSISCQSLTKHPTWHHADAASWTTGHQERGVECWKAYRNQTRLCKREKRCVARTKRMGIDKRQGGKPAVRKYSKRNKLQETGRWSTQAGVVNYSAVLILVPVHTYYPWDTEVGLWWDSTAPPVKSITCCSLTSWSYWLMV